jgi:hypothetical protein
MTNDLIQKIVTASNMTHQKNGSSSFMIVSSAVAEQLYKVTIKQERKEKLKKIFKNENT